MTLEEIKNKMHELGMNITDLASRLDITADGLGRILSGKRPLTGQLANHIKLLLTQPREATLLYKVNITEGTVAELLGDRACTVKADRDKALEAIIRHNLVELVEKGAKLDWTDEERKALGLPPAGQPLPPGFIPDDLHLTEEK